MPTHEKDSSENYTVICFYNTKWLSVEVQDRVESFHFKVVPEAEVKTRVEEQKVAGLDIYLIRQIMDEVRYYQEPYGLKRLVKKNV